VADDGNGRGAEAIVIFQDQAAGGGIHAQAGEIAARYQFGIQDFGLALHHSVRSASVSIGEEAGEDFAVRAKKVKSRQRIVGAARAIAVAVAGAMLAMNDRRPILGPPLDYGKLLGMRHRQGAHHDGVHKAVDGRIRADAQRQRQRGHGRKQRIGGHHAQAIAQILRELFPNCPGRHRG